MSVKYIPPSKNVGESVHDINDNFAALDKQSEAIARTVANKADATDVQNLAEQLSNKANTSDLDSKADKTSLASKVDNDQTGATELIDALGESNATPGTEDSFIVKNLNQYTRRPFTALLNWIKSNLAKVATSGSYNDLTNKPDIPTVDSSFSESGTNAVAGNTILAALNSKANKTELQALSNQVSNKADKSELGTAATKDVDTTVTSNSANLITSGGVYSKLCQYRPMVTLPGTSGKIGYVCFAELKVVENYTNAPIEFKISSRGRFICNVTVRFVNKGNTDPDDIETLSFCGQDYKIYAYKSATSTWELYALKSESYDAINVLATYRPGQFNGTITHPGTFVATKHTGTTTNPVVSASWGYAVKTAKTADNATQWNGLTDDTMTENTTDTRLMVLNGNKVQHRQIDTLPFLSSKDLSQSVLFTSTTNTTSATITGLFANYSLVWFQVVGSKTTHTHILPLKYLKSKGSLTFKDSGTPINILYVSDTQIRWFEYQGQGAETYTSVTIVKII